MIKQSIETKQMPIHETPVLLCVDSESVLRPSLIGLPEEPLETQTWLELCNTGIEYRRTCASALAGTEAWVISSDDVDAINIAATVKRDNPSLRVILVVDAVSGSIASRAAKAGIDDTMDVHRFAAYYTAHKQARILRSNAGQPNRSQRETRKPAHAKDSASDSPESIWAPRHAARKTAAGEQEAYDFLTTEDESAVGLAASTNYAAQEVPFDKQNTQGIDMGQVLERTGRVESGKSSAVASRRAFVVPVVSGSGGVGKSTIATLCAVVAHDLGYRTLLIDGDLQFGDAASMVGNDEDVSLDAFERSVDADVLKHENETSPSVIASLKKPEQAERIIAQLPAIIDACSPHFDVIFVNTGAFWCEEQAILIERSDKTLFVIDQRPSSLASCKKALELCARCGIATSPLLFLINRCGKGALYTSIDISCALQGAHVFELRDGGFEVEELLTAGQPLDLLRSQNELCVSIQRLLLSFLPELEGGAKREVVSKQRSWSIFGRGAKARG